MDRRKIYDDLNKEIAQYEQTINTLERTFDIINYLYCEHNEKDSTLYELMGVIEEHVRDYKGMINACEHDKDFYVC